MYSLIGAALIIGLLICFSVLAILWLSKVVTSSIKKKTVDLFSTYDYILEEKARTVKEIQSQEMNAEIPAADQMEEIKKPKPRKEDKIDHRSNISTKLLTSSYRDKNVGSIYQKIRYGFTTKPEEALAEIEFDKNSDESQVVHSILENISFDSFFKLTSLSEEEQLAILNDVFNARQKKVLEEYVSKTKKFSSISFYDYLNDINERERVEPILRVSPSLDISNVPKEIDVIVDDGILEGFVIETGSKIYDYSIKVREIS